jgi:hypothetical protein
MPVAKAIQDGLVERTIVDGEVGYIELQGDLDIEIGGFRHIGDEPRGGSANETPSEDEIRAYLSRMYGRPATDAEVAAAIERQARTGEFTGRVAPFPPPDILAMRHDDLGNVPTQQELPAFLRPGEGEPSTWNQSLDELEASGALSPGGRYDPIRNYIGEAVPGIDQPRPQPNQGELPFGPFGGTSMRGLPNDVDFLMRQMNSQPTPEGPIPTQPDLPSTVSRTGIGAKPETIVTPAIRGGVNGPEWYNHPDKIGGITDPKQAAEVDEYWHNLSMERYQARDYANAEQYATLADLAKERYDFLTDLYAGQGKPKSEIEARQRDIENRYQADGFARDKYRLPDGAIVPVDATATKGVQTTDFTMRDGKIVKMEYVGPMGPTDKIDMKTGRIIEVPKVVVRPMTEYGSKQWGIYVNNQLMEGGFFSQKAAKNSASNYGEFDTSTPYPELPEGFEDEFSRSFKNWEYEQGRAYTRGQLDLPMGETKVHKWDVFDTEDGQPIRTFDSQSAAEEFIALHPNKRLDYDVHDPFHPDIKPRNELGQFISAMDAAKQQKLPLEPEFGWDTLPGGTGKKIPPISGGEDIPKPDTTPRPTDPPVQPPGNVPPDQVPPGSRPPIPDEPPASVKKTPWSDKSWWEQAYDFVRNLTTGADISAPMRQGLPLIATKSWWTSWGGMLKAWGSQAAYDANQKSITDHYLFKARELANGKRIVGFGQRMGLRLIDQIDHIEEVTASTLAEKYVPGIKQSNRAYNAFLNKLRADTFTNLIEDAERLGKNPFTDERLAREIAEFVNTATGAASLKTDVPAWMSRSRQVSFEQSAKQLGYFLFSPRQTFSRGRMMNPLTYMNAHPYVRKQYMKAMISSVGAWSTIAGAAAASGYADEVSLDPTSADFGKIRVGKTRLDAGGGFQQYFVATARLLSGQRTTAASAGGPGNTQVLGEGYQARTGLDVAQMFISNKIHPLTKYAYDMLAASEYQPFHVADKTLQLVIPLYMQDAYEIIREDRPEILPLLFPAAIGMGTQTYEAGAASERLVSPEYDYLYKGGERPWSGLYRR